MVLAWFLCAPLKDTDSNAGNRFEVLGRRSPSLRRNDVDRTSTYQRHSRYGRGSREGKRRRDARRNRRRLAAIHTLDEQLSRDIERTLRQANVQEPTPLRFPSSASSLPVTGAPYPKSMDVTTKSPQTPYFNFGGLDLVDQIPQGAPSKRPLSPRTLPHLNLPKLPSWCPSMPSFLNDSTKWNEFPLFFDLSKLPDPIERPKPTPRCQDLQLWRPTVNALPNKQLSSTLTTTSPKLDLKVSSTACKLHDAGRGSRNVATQTDTTVANTMEPNGQIADDIGNDGRDEETDAYPANLWRVLNTAEKGNLKHHNDPCIASLCHEPTEDGQAGHYLPYEHRLEAVGVPCELENTELPFVHSNSLTGHANERATLPLPGSDEELIGLNELVVHECAEEEYANAVLAALDWLPQKLVKEPPIGLNELVVDEDPEEECAEVVLAILGLLPLPPSPGPESTAPVLPTAVQATCENIESEEEPAKCDAHYKSEKALFEPQSPVIKPRDDDIVDDTAFFQIGHTSECRCKDCNDPPELVAAENITDEDEWMDFLTLRRSRSPSLSSA